MTLHQPQSVFCQLGDHCGACLQVVNQAIALGIILIVIVLLLILLLCSCTGIYEKTSAEISVVADI